MGEVPGNDVILEWTDPRPMKATHIALMTGWKSGGMDWELKPVEKPRLEDEACPVVPLCPHGCSGCDECEMCTDCDDYYQLVTAGGDAVTGKCAPCPDNCLSCKNDVCSGCAPKTFLNEARECVKDCGSGWFPMPPAGGVCMKCNEACTECYGGDISECTACNEGFQKEDGKDGCIPKGEGSRWIPIHTPHDTTFYSLEDEQQQQLV